MKRHLKDYFVPHAENSYKPACFRSLSVITLASVILLVFVLSALHSTLLRQDSEFLAAVLPAVLVDLTNQDRSENGLSQLSRNPLLEEAAKLKAEHMAANEYFEHMSPDGTSPWHWFIQAGYSFTTAGENLAVHFSDSEDVADAWMNSPGHRANILNANFTEIGIATARGSFEGRDTIFVVQMFGTPAKVAAAPPPPQPQEPPAPEAQVAEAQTEAMEELEVIIEDDLFIAVQQPEERPADIPEVIVPGPEDATTTELGSIAQLDDAEGTAVAGTEAEGLVEPNVSFAARMFSQPHQLMTYFYLLIAGFIVVALILMVVIELEKQHPRNVMYGIMLLILVMALLYVGRTYLFADLLIV